LKDENKMKEQPPEVCAGCYRFNEFGTKCTFYWNEKKECGSRVKDYDDMLSTDHLRRR
jgi:hypothetical protein